MRRFILAALAAAVSTWSPVALAAPLTSTYNFGPASQIDYHVVHMLHEVTGVSHALLGKVSLSGDHLATPFTLQIPLLTFRSGNANRDANAASILDIGRYATATIEIVRFAETSRTPGAGGALTIMGDATGKLTLHGVTQPVTIPIRAHLAADGLTVDGNFDVSLTAHKIARPSLLFKPIEDAVKVSVHGVAAPVH